MHQLEENVLYSVCRIIKSTCQCKGTTTRYIYIQVHSAVYSFIILHHKLFQTPMPAALSGRLTARPSGGLEDAKVAKDGEVDTTAWLVLKPNAKD